MRYFVDAVLTERCNEFLNVPCGDFIDTEISDCPDRPHQRVLPGMPGFGIHCPCAGGLTYPLLCAAKCCDSIAISFFWAVTIALCLHFLGIKCQDIDYSGSKLWRHYYTVSPLWLVVNRLILLQQGRAMFYFLLSFKARAIVVNSVSCCSSSVCAIFTSAVQSPDGFSAMLPQLVK